jgi:UDP-N-acetylmuramoylalanine--D-glutamate ligase
VSGQRIDAAADRVLEGAGRTMEEFSVEGRRVVVVGAARSGAAAAHLLAARRARVTLTDLRPAIDGREELEAAGITLELGRHDPETLRRAELIVLSPGVPPWQPLLDAPRRAGTEIIGELELASRWFRGRVIAITGTKGKSTTTTLVGEMLREGGIEALVGGNLGPAASLQVAATGPDVVHVLEASSFQLETTTSFRPHIAVFLNFSPDHLDRHRTEAEYAAAKARVFANQTGEDLAIVNADDDQVMRMAGASRARRLPFSVSRLPEDGVGIRDGVIARATAAGPEPLVPVSAVRLLGTHLLADVVAAAATAAASGVGADAIRRAVEGFRGLEHALEPVATVGGVRFVNDSKATNVDAARRALEAFDGGVVPILGGRFKGGDLAVLAAALRRRARAVVAIGESQGLFASELGGVVPVEQAASLREAVERAWQLARPDGIVLLAPACASFDMFRDYAERGRMFKEEVSRLRRRHAGEP